MYKTLFRYLKIYRASKIIWPEEASDYEIRKLNQLLSSGNTLANSSKLWATYSSMKYVISNSIPGDFLEVGCWKGGHMMAAGLAQHFSKSELPRVFHGVDVFDSGFVNVKKAFDDLPSKTRNYLLGEVKSFENINNVMLPETSNKAETELICQSFLPNVNFRAHQFDIDEYDSSICFDLPVAISVLRLDSDFYHSTYSALDIFEPLVVNGGVILLDDYGHWSGSKRAVDEYFADKYGALPL